ncbi:MAG: autotransporter outer membrane beta-barrel domain-containing protein [Lautropia sp.]|nr:autotransporter outer membrane beta-barrel domain-containing protein [Lautropia sp.]
MLATALLMASPLSASAGESVDIYQKASRSFADQVQGSVQTHLSQIRARQQRLIRARGRDLPRFMNQLELADSSSSIPLQPIPYLRDTGNRLLHSAPGKTNVYIRGTLYSINNGDGLGLTTPGTIIGSDQLVKEDVAIGFATGRITTRKSSGTLVSAYLSMQPTSALMVDMSLSLGQHRARNDFLQSYANGRLGVSGYSQALSLSVNRQPQLFRGWTFSPYSRYDVVATRIEAGRLDANHWHGSRAQSSLSFGSVMETEWFGMFGPIQPRLQLEVRHQIADGSGLVNTRYKTHGMIGLGLTSRLSRDMATFAESRYATESGSANPESLLMLGIRLFF